MVAEAAAAFCCRGKDGEEEFARAGISTECRTDEVGVPLMLGEWGICGEVMRGIGLAGDSLRGDVMVAIVDGGRGGLEGWRLAAGRLGKGSYILGVFCVGTVSEALCAFEKENYCR